MRACLASAWPAAGAISRAAGETCAQIKFFAAPIVAVGPLARRAPISRPARRSYAPAPYDVLAHRMTRSSRHLGAKLSRTGPGRARPLSWAGTVPCARISARGSLQSGPSLLRTARSRRGDDKLPARTARLDPIRAAQTLKRAPPATHNSLARRSHFRRKRPPSQVGVQSAEPSSIWGLTSRLSRSRQL